MIYIASHPTETLLFEVEIFTCNLFYYSLAVRLRLDNGKEFINLICRDLNTQEEIIEQMIINLLSNLYV